MGVGRERLRPGNVGGKVRDVSSARAKVDKKVMRFVERMTREERMLVMLKRELYEGSWDEMEADLRARLEGRPYIFKLAHRITDDLQRIEKIRQFENDCSVDLGDYIEIDH